MTCGRQRERIRFRKRDVRREIRAHDVRSLSITHRTLRRHAQYADTLRCRVPTPATSSYQAWRNQSHHLIGNTFLSKHDETFALGCALWETVRRSAPCYRAVEISTSNVGPFALVKLIAGASLVDRNRRLESFFAPNLEFSLVSCIGVVHRLRLFARK